MVATHLDGGAQVWYQIAKWGTWRMNWSELKNGLTWRFGPTEFNCRIGELIKLEQTGSVIDYVKYFKCLLCLLSLVNPRNDDNHSDFASSDQSELVGRVVYELGAFSFPRFDGSFYATSWINHCEQCFELCDI